MSIALRKPWRPLTREGIAPVAGHLGVYELADDDGQVVFVGFAGGRSLHGLRGELQRWVARAGSADAPRRYRIEVTTAYATRWRELLALHVAMHGGLPRDNPAEDQRAVGRLSPG